MANFTDVLKERAKKSIKTIVLPEGEDVRSVKAAHNALEEA